MARAITPAGGRGNGNGWLMSNGSVEELEEGVIYRGVGGPIKKSQGIGKVPWDKWKLQGARAAGPPRERSK